MDRRTLAIFFSGLLVGCGGSGEEPVAFDCPTERIATATDLHTAGGRCADARARVGENLESHHYKVACQTAQGERPPHVEAARVSACREDDRGAWADVEVCCPTASMVAYLRPPRRERLEIVAPAVGKYGTASISLTPPPSSTEFHIRIPPENCDVFQLYPSSGCEAGGSYDPGQTTTFMVRYAPNSTHRRGGVLAIDYVDPALTDVEVRLSGRVGADESGRLSMSVR